MQVSTHHDGYKFTLVHNGGRLADVLIDGKCVDCTTAHDYDWQKGELIGPAPDRAALKATLAEWIADSAEDYLRELPYL